MFQLYKKRDFSAYISDSIAFFRGYWKNFLENYVIIAGGAIFALCVCFFFIFRDLFSTLLNTRNQGVGYDWGYYFSNNQAMFITLVSIATIVGLLLSIFSMAYPVAYLQLMENTGKTKFTSTEILSQIKLYLPKLIKFTLFSIFVIFPALILASVLAAVLIVVVIGIFLLIFLIPLSPSCYIRKCFSFTCTTIWAFWNR